ncbi:DNA methyltransferase [Vibrio scophthalmi]|uniref:S-adenosyl-L-methionine-dependent methyltransferases family protein VrlL n=1 Tax=Vibrio scophthalmi LMG 19158 TaxID=870967 RepID=F9RKN7_9VIBR|nr:DNA methyltransferase [Vibrio scophthalmi]EGU39458.1 S-adenosyl-L-methionine-dependent methyltransferases family protein VrlL [Vibrio scophthalmi LMG 19158]
MKQDNLFDIEGENKAPGPVDCLGMTFESDEARRNHFTELLREKLKDPEFRAIEGFPIGTDEAILGLSDPPFYTACPNPWLSDFANLWESQKQLSEEEYFREPFAADVSEGKNDPIYNAHSYHTKVPHKAVMRYILHYTKPGDVVLDSFCGSGMTGVAGQLCGDRSVVESLGYRVLDNDDIQQEFFDIESNETKRETFSKLGKRNILLNDIAPIATLISSNYNQAIDNESFVLEAENIINEIFKEYSWLYKTKHSDGSECDINCVVWSDVFLCPECSGEIVLWNEGIDKEVGKVKNTIECSCCTASLVKKQLIRKDATVFDPALKKTIVQAESVPVLIVYKHNGKRYKKSPDSDDIKLLKVIDECEITFPFPNHRMIEGKETRRNDPSGITHLHHFYTKRNMIVLSALKERIKSSRYYKELQFQLDSLVIRQSKLTRFLVSYFFHGGGGWVGTPLSGTLYIPSFSVEVQPFETWLNRIPKTLSRVDTHPNTSAISTGNAGKLNIPDNSVDYIFLDPPFGSNISYSELSFLWESWLEVRTAIEKEAIESSAQSKSLDCYRALMSECFKEAARVLKPGHWITIEFSNTKASVWNSIQTAIRESGLIVANVSALDKKQGSFKAVTTTTAVKQDLVISAYKPKDDIEIVFNSKTDDFKGVWEFISSHLSFLPITKYQGSDLVKIPERDPRILFDQLITTCIRKGIQVPLSSQDFLKGLLKRFVEREGMVFLPEQVAEYDRKRALSNEVMQLSIFVDDEASAIEWMRQELKEKPKTYSEIHPLFLNELSGWKKNELELELSTLLEQNFIKYDGKDEVPAQIHTYLSTNFKDMRGLDKSDPKLVAKAKDRWYVPDPNKAADLEKVRLRALLKEFETYKVEKKKIKQPRAEALRAGFNTAWEAQDFQTILDISAKIPPAVLQEDEKLLMFYDNALTLTSTEDDEW